MKKVFRRILVGVLVCMMACAISTSAFAEKVFNLYHTIGGGPSSTTGTCWFYKNTGNIYYADCTTLTNSTARVDGINNTPSKELYFTSTKKIYFLATTYEDTLGFKATMTVKDSHDVAFANITIGA